MKKRTSLFLASVLLVCSLVTVPVGAEEVQTPTVPETTTAPEPSIPAQTVPVTQPEEETITPEGEGTTPTEPAGTLPPAACTHVYGEWTADESIHSHSCTLCGYGESSSHSWAAEIITVAPTCKDVGGKAKICTVCQGILVVEIIPQLPSHTYDNACDPDCNVCGTTQEVTHTYGTGWTYSYKGHWHKCTICGAAGEVKAHYAGPAATEEKDQICLTCGYILTKKLGHTHSWGSQWNMDEAGHWYDCSGCSEKKEYAAHAYGDTCDPDCDVCGYARQTGHKYDGWKQDETGHWQVCTLCGVESTLEPHTAEDVCGICRYEVAHTHAFPMDWRQDEMRHWQECACGERAEETAHIWDEGTEEDGMIIYFCEVCQAEKQEKVPESGFPWWILILAVLLFSGVALSVVFILMGRRKGNYAR